MILAYHLFFHSLFLTKTFLSLISISILLISFSILTTCSKSLYRFIFPVNKISFTEELSEVSIPGGPQQPQTVWLSSGSEDPVTCRAFSEDGEELPMDSYSCRGNTILIEDDGWIFRIIL